MERIGVLNMELLNRIEELEKELLELKEQVKGQQEFPQSGERYWYNNGGGMVNSCFWKSEQLDLNRYRIGNMFKTEKEAEFAVEKLKVEAELRKYSRPFKEDDYNSFIELYMFDKTPTVDSNEYWQTQGVIYFESDEKAQQAIDAVGEERIKKYIFGVEE